MQANAHGLGGGPERTFERITIVRDLKGRKVPVAIAHAFGPSGAELAVVERYVGDAPTLDVLEKDARITMSLRHPNIAQVRDVWREGGELRVASELIEGETLEEVRTLALGGKELTIEVGVRIVVDVLAALSALHALGSGGLTHGEITAGNVIVGFDGTTRLVRPFHGHVAGKLAEPDWFSYAAPEVVRGAPSHVRSDLFAVGVLLWETLSRRKLFPKATREGRLARNLPIGKPQPPADATWAAPLSAVAERALANDPDARYTSAAEMAAAVRLAVRSKLAMPPRVAALVDKLACTRILERRNTNRLPESLGSPSMRVGTSVRPSVRPSVPDDAVRALAAMRPSSRPPTPKPGAVMPVVPKAPPLPSVDTLDVVRGPRPLAPPLRLAAAPIPAAPPSEPERIFAPDEAVTVPKGQPVALAEPVPVSLDDALLEPLPSLQTPAASTRRRWIAIGGAVLLVVLLATAAIVGAIVSRSGSPTPPRPTASVQPSKTVAAIVPPVANPPAVTTATVVTPTATASVVPEPSSSADVDPSASAAPTTRPHTRPRPTYDPMGI